MSSEGNQLQRVRIFCASPGDVGCAREAVKKVVGELANIHRNRGVALEFDGWEATGPSAGRPQDEINKLVDECDVFVGLLNERWGHPTGAYKSGFEEEYLRAYARFLEEKAPELFIFFKSHPQPDPEVQEFRERLECRQEVYYREFNDVGDLESRLRQRLEEYLYEGPKPPRRPRLIAVMGRAVHLVIPAGWEDLPPAKLAEMKTLEPPGGETHIALYRPDAPDDVIYSMRATSVLGLPDDFLRQAPPESWPRLVERATGLHVTTPVSRVAFGDGVGYRWTLNGSMDGTRVSRPHQASVAMHSIEMWVPLASNNGLLKFQCFAPPNRADEAAKDFNAMISSWRW